MPGSIFVLKLIKIITTIGVELEPIVKNFLNSNTWSISYTSNFYVHPVKWISGVWFYAFISRYMQIFMKIYAFSIFSKMFMQIWIQLILLKTENWKNYNKIIFKCMNSTVGLIFNFFFNKMVIDPINSTWIVYKQCVNNVFYQRQENSFGSKHILKMNDFLFRVMLYYWQILQDWLIKSLVIRVWRKRDSLETLTGWSRFVRGNV